MSKKYVAKTVLMKVNVNL